MYYRNTITLGSSALDPSFTMNEHPYSTEAEAFSDSYSDMEIDYFDDEYEEFFPQDAKLRQDFGFFTVMKNSKPKKTKQQVKASDKARKANQDMLEAYINEERRTCRKNTGCKVDHDHHSKLDFVICRLGHCPGNRPQDQPPTHEWFEGDSDSEDDSDSDDNFNRRNQCACHGVDHISCPSNWRRPCCPLQAKNVTSPYYDCVCGTWSDEYEFVEVNGTRSMRYIGRRLNCPG